MVWQVGAGGLYGVQEIAVSQLVHISKACGERSSGGRPDEAVHGTTSDAHSAAL